MDILSDLKEASLENLANDPSLESQHAGRVWRNHTEDEVRCMMGTEVKYIPSIENDEKLAELDKNFNDYSSIGEIRMAYLTQSQFQSEMGPGWVSADGRNVSGSSYATLTGASNIPDLRGVFLRGKDNGRGINPDGDLALGSYQGDSLESHNHIVRVTAGSNGGSIPSTATSTTAYQQPYSTNASGGNETRPNCSTINYFIRIN